MEPSIDDQKNSKPVTGYPTVQGYIPPCQGYAPPCPNYPAAPGSFNCPPQPPNFSPHGGGAAYAYYGPKQGYHLPPPVLLEEHNSGPSFNRIMFYVMFLIIMITSSMAFVTWLIFAMKMPDLTITSLVVPAFDLRNGTLNAEFQINIMVTKCNDQMEFSVHQAESMLLYKETQIAQETVEKNVELVGIKERGFLHAKLVSNSSLEGGEVVEGSVVEELEKDRKRGIVSFDFEVALDATFKSGSMWRRQKINVYCGNLPVAFNSSTGVGTLDTCSGPVKCLNFS